MLDSSTLIAWVEFYSVLSHQLINDMDVDVDMEMNVDICVAAVNFFFLPLTAGDPSETACTY